MPLPPFIKSPTFLTGFGCVSSGAIGVGGGQVWEGAHPTGHRSLSRRGFNGNPAVPELQSDVSSTMHSISGSSNKYQLEFYGCFRNFFPGTSYKQSWGNDGSFTDPINSSGVDVNSSFSTPVGCALMDLSYEGNDTNNSGSIYVLKAEITVKNDKFGWVLGAGSKRTYNSNSSGGSGSFSGDTSYYLLFLKKENKGVDGSVIGGYSGSDTGASSTNYALDKLHIFAPGGKDGAETIRNHKDKTIKKFERYSGIWEVSEDGKEIFQDIEVWYGDLGQRSESAEILGREFKSGSSSVDFSQSSGPEIYATHGYKENEGGIQFQNCGSGKDIGNTLNTFYAPWSGKKGSGREMKDYCKDNYYRRDISGGELEKLQSFCYSK